MTWTGTMPTRFLNDKQIRPIEFTKWRQARDQFARCTKDREKVDALKALIPKQGLPEPLLLGISERYREDVYVGDGHHRAVALMELGITEFPFHWYWIRSFGVQMERKPFPYDVLGL